VRLFKAEQWFRDHRQPVRLIICKSRRAGLSTGVEALIFDDSITRPNTNSLIIGHQATPSENVLGMCKTFLEHLPKAIKFKTPEGDYVVNVRPDLHKKYAGNMPSDKIEFAPPLNSKIFIATAKSIDAYRSFAFQNIHATEVAHYDDAPGLFEAVTATVGDDPNTAVYMESTPNGMGGKGAFFHEECIHAELRGGEPEYGESMLLFIPWHEMPISFSVPFDSMENRHRFELSLRQTEKDLMLQYPAITLEQLHWRRIKLSKSPYNRDEERFLAQYPTDLVTCFLTSGTMVFSRLAMQRLSLNTRRPEWVGDIYWGESDEQNRNTSPYNYVRHPQFLSQGKAESAGFAPHTAEKTYDNLKVWAWPQNGDRIIIGADVARGNPNTEDGDYSTICVLRVNDLFQQDELIMTWRGRINVIEFGDVCASLAWAIRYNVGDKVVAPILAPEWTGTWGTALCTYIDERRLYPLWHYRTPGMTGMPPTKHVGWESSNKTKPFAVAAMVDCVEKNRAILPSKELAMEMSSYKQLGFSDGETQYGSVGTHDDLVSSFQIAYAISRLEAAIDPQQSDEPFEVDLDALPVGDAGGAYTAEAFDEFDARESTLGVGSRGDDAWNTAEAFDEFAVRDWM
jgi:hypothetical protein